MNTTQFITEIETGFGKIYLVLNRTHGYYTILPLVENNFLSFLEDLFKEIDIDDYEINYRYLIESSLKGKIIDYLHNIFKTKNLTFTIHHKITSSNDIFINLNDLLVNHILNNQLLENFKLLKNDDNLHSDDKGKKNIILDIKDQCNISTKLEKNINNIESNDNILPYNHYEVLEDIVIPVPNIKLVPIKYYSWKADEFTNNPDNFNWCAIIYCVSQGIGIVISNEDIIHVDYLIKNFKDFELIKKYSKLDKKELDNIKNYFHKRDFENSEIIIKKINSFESLFDINNDKKKDIINNEIEAFIRDKYRIDNDPKNMIKANEILGQVILELQYVDKDKMKLSKELSNILLHMGLKKKRMSDGIYYYGIVPTQSYSTVTTDEKYKKVVEEHKLESVSEILDKLKFRPSCSIRNGPCQCLDVKDCDRVVVPRLHEGFSQKNYQQIAI